MRGGVPATHSFLYDANGNLSVHLDADDSDGSSANGVAGLPGDRTRHLYDGFDRRVSTVDAAGNQVVHQLDPDGHVRARLHFGASEGATPTDDGPDPLPQPVSELGVLVSGNLVVSGALSITEHVIDEAGHCIRVDRVLFHNSLATQRLVDIEDGGVDVGKSNPIDGDDSAIAGAVGITIHGRVNTVHEYDRNGKRVATTGDDGDRVDIEYDGLDRPIRVTDPAGNVVELAYDDASNLIEVAETDVASLPGVADQTLLTTHFYDALGRCVRSVDNLGHTVHRAFDSHDQCVATADAEGPAGATIARRVFEPGPGTVDTTNDPGNVTLYRYDGAGRAIERVQILTASGSGSGDLGVDTHGVPTGSLIGDPTQGGGDGQIRQARRYDGNSNLVATIDDQGNASAHLYDDLDRIVARLHGITASTLLDEAALFGARSIPFPTQKTQRAPRAADPIEIQSQLTALELRLAPVFSRFPTLANRVDPPTVHVAGLDPDGLARLALDENGTERHEQYDALERVIARRWYRAGQSDTHPGFPRYWPEDLSSAAVFGTDAQEFEYDGLGRVVRTFDSNGCGADPGLPECVDQGVASTHSYDSLGRIVEESLEHGGNTEFTSLAWRAEALEASVTYPDESVVASTYDALDRPTAISEGTPAAALATFDYIGTRLLQRTYPESGLVLTLLDPSGREASGYDALRRVASMRHESSTTGATLVGFDFSHDRRSHLVAHDKTHDPTQSDTRDYDSAGRLISFTRLDPLALPPVHAAWELDGVGNWASVDGELRAHTNHNELYSRLDALGVGVESAHDENSNTVDDGTGVSYEYDPLDRLVRVRKCLSLDPADCDDAEPIDPSDFETSTYRYDALGRRIHKRVEAPFLPPADRLFSYGGERLLAERDETGAAVARYVWAHGTPIVFDRVDSGGIVARSYAHEDAGGSIHALTDVAGAAVEGYFYDAHGRPNVVTPGLDGVLEFGGDDEVTPNGASAIDNPHLHARGYHDRETQLYLEPGARSFSPERGRALGERAVEGCLRCGRSYAECHCCWPIDDLRNLGHLGLDGYDPRTISSSGSREIRNLGHTGLDGVDTHLPPPPPERVIRNLGHTGLDGVDTHLPPSPPERSIRNLGHTGLDGVDTHLPPPPPPKRVIRTLGHTGLDGVDTHLPPPPPERVIRNLGHTGLDGVDTHLPPPPPPKRVIRNLGHTGLDGFEVRFGARDRAHHSGPHPRVDPRPGCNGGLPGTQLTTGGPRYSWIRHHPGHMVTILRP